MLTPAGWFALGVVGLVLLLVQIQNRISVDVLFLGGMLAVTLAGILDPEDTVRGFSSSAVITIGGLLVVSAGLRATGVLDWVGQTLLGSARTEGSALRRLALALVPTSAMVLNTPLVAMMTPVVVDWCRRRNVSPSKLLIPLSYLVILGGVCSLIGTSTTLIVNGLLRDEYAVRRNNVDASELPADAAQGAARDSTSSRDAQRAAAFVDDLRPMPLFEIGKVGLPCALVGAVFLILLAPYLLPDRQELIESLEEERREYLVEMEVKPSCPLVGQTIEDAGLRSLPGLYLIEIDRDGEVITPVAPDDHIHRGDRLVFTGIVRTIVDLERIPGFVPTTDTAYEFHSSSSAKRYLTEAVLSRTSPLIGQTLKEADFRRRYDAAVVAVHRNGSRLSSKLGDVELEPGDTLLLQTRNEFVSRYRNSRDFYLVSSVDGYTPRHRDRAWVAAGLGLLLIAWLSLAHLMKDSPTLGGLGSTAVAAVTIALLMVLCRCLPVGEARNALDLQILLTIVGALGMGIALNRSGAASAIAQGLVGAVGDRPYLTLIVVYLLGMALTEMLTNNAVAALLIPLAIDIAWEGGYNPRPFVMAISLSASLSFITPVGYQTNLMVMGPGNYRPSDYLRAGVPLAILVACTALFLIPRIWPLQ